MRLRGCRHLPAYISTPNQVVFHFTNSVTVRKSLHHFEIKILISFRLSGNVVYQNLQCPFIQTILSQTYLFYKNTFLKGGVDSERTFCDSMSCPWVLGCIYTVSVQATCTVISTHCSFPLSKLSLSPCLSLHFYTHPRATAFEEIQCEIPSYIFHELTLFLYTLLLESCFIYIAEKACGYAGLCVYTYIMCVQALCSESLSGENPHSDLKFNR